MKTIHLLRHAKSSWDDPGLADRDRPLAARGLKAARLIAAHIAREGLRVDFVLCSSATRARQTLEPMVPALGEGVDVRIDDELYGADAGEVLASLQGIEEKTGAVLVVGHNPALQELTENLVHDGQKQAIELLRRKFPTGALATITAETTWRQLGFGSGYLESFVVPRQLSRS